MTSSQDVYASARALVAAGRLVAACVTQDLAKERAEEERRLLWRTLFHQRRSGIEYWSGGVN